MRRQECSRKGDQGTCQQERPFKKEKGSTGKRRERVAGSRQPKVNGPAGAVSGWDRKEVAGGRESGIRGKAGRERKKGETAQSGGPAPEAGGQRDPDRSSSGARCFPAGVRH